MVREIGMSAIMWWSWIALIVSLHVGIIGMPQSGLSQQLSPAYLLLSASWIRDSSFTLYALIRLGFTHEANGLFCDKSKELSLTVQ